MANVDPSPVDYLGDPLSGITRAERRNLLIASTVGVLVGKVGLVPTEIATFGLTFGQEAQDSFIWLVAVTLVYFVIAFLIYGLADFLILYKKRVDYLEGVALVQGNWTQEDQRSYEELRESVPDVSWVYRVSSRTLVVRALFEFALPLPIAVFALISLIQTLWSS